MVTDIHHALVCTARPPRPRRRPLPDAGSPGAPHSVWIAPPHAIKTPIAAGSELPIWAFEEACTEYAPHHGPIAVMPGPDTPFDTEPAPSPLAPRWLRAAEQTDLPAPDMRPLALAIVLNDPPEHTESDEHNPTQASRAARFYRTVNHILAPGGIALVHTHTEPTPNGLLDPAATLIRAAQTAGLAYLQHIVIVHHRLDAPTTPRYRPPAQRPVPPTCRRVHSDLYVLTKTDTEAPRR